MISSIVTEKLLNQSVRSLIEFDFDSSVAAFFFRNKLLLFQPTIGNMTIIYNHAVYQYYSG